MKKLKFMIVASIAILMFASCSSSDDTLSDLTTEETESMVDGNWRVTYYFDNSDGESTDDFTGYTFDFNTDGSLIAINGTNTFTGSWLVKNSDDDPAFSKEIEILIAGNKAMEELDGSWLIVNLTETLMEFKDDNGAEEIKFEKI